MRDYNSTSVSPRWSETLVSGLIVFGLGLFGAGGIAFAASAPARFPIESAKIEEAMRDAAMPTINAEVKLAVPMTATVTDPTLQVDSVVMIDPRTIRVRLACRDRSQCLAFFATVSYPQDVPAGSLLRAKLPSDSSAKAMHVGSPSLSVGAQAMLECDAEKIHIRIEVICLEAGAVGSRIRVSSLDHKQVYMARVVAPDLLKGELLK